jgi:hypothetical protein
MTHIELTAIRWIARGREDRWTEGMLGECHVQTPAEAPRPNVALRRAGLLGELGCRGARKPAERGHRVLARTRVRHCESEYQLACLNAVGTTSMRA